jgi:uncharacterized protein YbjT (DUF2867 family)
MSTPILVTGATGRLGQLVTARLLEQNQRVRVFTRRPEAARALFGARVEIAAGDFADRDSLHKALAGTRKLFLLSPISERLAEEQIAAAGAAVIEGGSRIVKISGSDWTIDPPGVSISGDAHAAVEWHLRGLNIEHVSIRPNAWMQVGLLNTIRQAVTGLVLNARHGAAGVAYIDARDIADVAVHQLLAPKVADKPLIITGSQAVSMRDIAAILARVLHRPIGIAENNGGVTPPLGDSFEHRAVAQFGTLIAAGRAATVTRAVPELLGHAPRTVEAFITEHFAADAALAG